MAGFTDFPGTQINAKPQMSEELLTMLLSAEVSSSVVGGFRDLSAKSCALHVALAESESDLRDALSEAGQNMPRHPTPGGIVHTSSWIAFWTVERSVEQPLTSFPGKPRRQDPKVGHASAVLRYLNSTLKRSSSTPHMDADARSHRVALFFDGSIPRPKKRLTSSASADHEASRNHERLEAHEPPC